MRSDRTTRLTPNDAGYAVTDASESQIGAGSKTAAVLENGNAIASAGNSTLELPASE